MPAWNGRLNLRVYRRLPHGVFLAKDVASLFYLSSEGMGGSGLPPDHPNQSRSISEVRGGHVMGSYAISAVAEGGVAWMPAVVIATCRRMLADSGYLSEDA